MIFACKDIAVGEEITLDYKVNIFKAEYLIYIYRFHLLNF